MNLPPAIKIFAAGRAGLPSPQHLLQRLEAIVLTGSVMKSASLFLDRIHQVIRQNCRLVPYQNVEISLASLGPDVGLIGAAEVWRNHFQFSGD